MVSFRLQTSPLNNLDSTWISTTIIENYKQTLGFSNIRLDIKKLDQLTI